MLRQAALFSATAAALAGCASLTPTEIDERSSVAGAIRTAEGTARRYPTFADIPATPRDVPTVAQYDQTVNGVRGEGAELQAWTVANPPINLDTEGYVAAQRGRTEAGGAVPPADQAQRTESYAEAARRRAQPPPPPS